MIFHSCIVLFFALSIFTVNVYYGKAQDTSWKLWAEGLQKGIYPRLSVSDSHEIYYGVMGTADTKGIITYGNTTDSQGSFVSLPPIPLPSSQLNNIQTIVTNRIGEPIVGIFRNNTEEPFLFHFDKTIGEWRSCSVDLLPNLGAFCSARASNGTIWVGTKWSYVYKSTDEGRTFLRIDESPKVKEKYPCYYPTYAGIASDGAVYSVNVDANNRVYVGTECAGIVYSDDEGATWHPANKFSCLHNDNSKKDTLGSMYPLTRAGNVGAIGITHENNVVFNGVDLWHFNWKNNIGYADLVNDVVTEVSGLPEYSITAGLQVSKIVTTENGVMFLHSGSNSSQKDKVGIYISRNGKIWQRFDTGIKGADIPQCQGSLAVDGNVVFMATVDGKIWRFDASELTTNTIQADNLPTNRELYRTDGNFVWLSVEGGNKNVTLYDILGNQLQLPTHTDDVTLTIDVCTLMTGVYFIQITPNEFVTYFKQE